MIILTMCIIELSFQLTNSLRFFPSALLYCNLSCAEGAEDGSSLRAIIMPH